MTCNSPKNLSFFFFFLKSLEIKTFNFSTSWGKIIHLYEHNKNLHRLKATEMKEILPLLPATTEYKKCKSKSDQWSFSTSTLSLMVAVGYIFQYSEKAHEFGHRHRNTGALSQGQGHSERKGKIGKNGTEKTKYLVLPETGTNCHWCIPHSKGSLLIAMLP